MLAAQPSRVSLEGGTHNPWAPPFHFLQRVFVPLLRKMGPTLELELERHGFYPGGGGSVVTSITPASELRGMKLMERGRVHTKRVRAMVSNLPIDIANREVSVIQRLSGWPAKCFEAYSVKAHGPGNIVLLETQCDRLSEMFVGFGREGVRAEKVARALWKEFREFDEADVPVGPHLADQILLPIGLANWQDSANTSRFRTVEPTQHTLTHIDILQRFLGVEIQVKDEDGTYVVSCS
jgi:RNA 3'-terminal phosphate cyclase (ATP)